MVRKTPEDFADAGQENIVKPVVVVNDYEYFAQNGDTININTTLPGYSFIEIPDIVGGYGVFADDVICWLSYYKTGAPGTFDWTIYYQVTGMGASYASRNATPRYNQSFFDAGFGDAPRSNLNIVPLDIDKSVRITRIGLQHFNHVGVFNGGANYQLRLMIGMKTSYRGLTT